MQCESAHIDRQQGFRHNGIMALVAVWMMLLSCEKETPPADGEFPEYIIFGQMFAELSCSNNEVCVEIFKMQSGQLLEDVSDTRPVPGEAYSTGVFSNRLSRDDYDAIMNLFGQKVPETLLAQESGLYFTENDFATYIFFEYKSPERHGYWLYNVSETGSLPTDVQQFIVKIQNAVSIASF
jgi:hypothetical protein